MYKICEQHLQCRMLSEKAGSGIAFLRKFNMDFMRAALWGKHWRPEKKQKKQKLQLMHCCVKTLYISTLHHFWFSVSPRDITSNFGYIFITFGNFGMRVRSNEFYRLQSNMTDTEGDWAEDSEEVSLFAWVAKYCKWCKLYNWVESDLESLACMVLV